MHTISLTGLHNCFYAGLYLVIPSTLGCWLSCVPDEACMPTTYWGQSRACTRNNEEVSADEENLWRTMALQATFRSALVSQYRTVTSQFGQRPITQSPVTTSSWSIHCALRSLVKAATYPVLRESREVLRRRPAVYHTCVIESVIFNASSRRHRNMSGLESGIQVASL